MIYNNSNQTSTANRAIASLFVAGVTFILGYTVVRATIGPAQEALVEGTEAAIVVPHEASLWADFAAK